MKIISFDVGIKNMAYCVLETAECLDKQQQQQNQTTTKILHWNVLNLMPQSTTQTDTQPNPKQPCSHCKKKAVYLTPPSIQPPQYFCIKHTTTTTFFLPIPKLNQMKKQELELIVNNDNTTTNTTKTKPELLEIIQNRMLVAIKPQPKQLKTQEVGLVEIGRSLHKQLLELQEQFVGLDYVLIENQISPIATRMKTIQGMLAMFFIQHCPAVPVQFISSHNKLTAFDTPTATTKTTKTKTKTTINPDNTTTTDPNNPAVKKEKQSYASNKKQAVVLVEGWLKQENNREWAAEWIEFFKQNKHSSDDLSDANLQGLWFLKTLKK